MSKGKKWSAEEIKAWEEELTIAAKSVMNIVRKNGNPHISVVVSGDRFDVFQGMGMFGEPFRESDVSEIRSVK